MEESAGTGQRSQFKAVFTDAHRRHFDMVLFWSLDRFSREGAFPTLMYLNGLESYGVGNKSLTEQYLDLTGLFKDAIISVLATIAKQERTRLSERTKAGLVRARSRGIKLERPAKALNLIQQVQQLKNEGYSSRTVAKTLHMSPSTVDKYLLK